jgi:hypothetical protein
MDIEFSIKHEVGGKMVWFKTKGTRATFRSVKALRNFLRNRRFDLKNPAVYSNGEKIDFS